MIFGEVAVPDNADQRVDIFNTATNRMSVPVVEFIHKYRVTT